MKKILIPVVIAIVIGAGLVYALLALPNTQEAPESAQTTQTAPPAETPQDVAETLAAGRYAVYDAGYVSDEAYTETILFFHAPWCPECRAFEAAIEGSTIPDGVQVLKVDYDSATELRQRYGVTLQSTFVSVDKSGNEVSTWVGYGKDKSVDAILENT